MEVLQLRFQQGSQQDSKVLHWSARPVRCPPLTQDELVARLQYSTLKVTRKRVENEEEPKERAALCLSLAKKKELLTLYHEWIECNPGLHAPF